MTLYVAIQRRMIFYIYQVHASQEWSFDFDRCALSNNRCLLAIDEQAFLAGEGNGIHMFLRRTCSCVLVLKTNTGSSRLEAFSCVHFSEPMKGVAAAFGCRGWLPVPLIRSLKIFFKSQIQQVRSGYAYFTTCNAWLWLERHAVICHKVKRTFSSCR